MLKHFKENLDKIHSSNISKVCKDVSDISVLNDVIKDCDLVVGALPGFMGFDTMKRVILAQKNIVDISFYPEDPFELDKLAKENNVIAVMDCGVAPGMGNIIFAHHNNTMKISDYECLVGGLPVKREWPAGRRVMNYRLEDGINSVNVSELSVGEYVLRIITNEGQMSSKKFIKH